MLFQAQNMLFFFFFVCFRIFYLCLIHIPRFRWFLKYLILRSGLFSRNLVWFKIMQKSLKSTCKASDQFLKLKNVMQCIKQTYINWLLKYVKIFYCPSRTHILVGKRCGLLFAVDNFQNSQMFIEDIFSYFFILVC